MLVGKLGAIGLLAGRWRLVGSKPTGVPSGITPRKLISAICPALTALASKLWVTTPQCIGVTAAIHEARFCSWYRSCCCMCCGHSSIPSLHTGRPDKSHLPGALGAVGWLGAEGVLGAFGVGSLGAF